MTEIPGIISGMIAAVPMLALPILWRNHRRSRVRALLEASVAITSSVLLVILLGFLLDSETARGVSAIPLLISGVVLAVSLNRTVNAANRAP